MPSSIPGAQLIGVDPLLTDFVVQYKQDLKAAGVLIADLICPPVSTEGERTGTYFKWGKESHFLSASVSPPGSHLSRAMGARYNRGQARSATTATYLCNEFGEEEVLDDRMTKGQGAKVLQIERNTADQPARLVTYQREVRVEALAFSTGVVTQNTTLAGTAQWNDEANSSPDGDLQTAIQTIYQNTGYHPRMSTHDLCCVMGEQVWRRMKRHPELASLIKGNNAPSGLKQEEVANYFEFDQFVVARGLKNTAEEGQTASLGRIIGKNVLVFYRAKGAPNKDIPSFGITFEQEPLEVEVYRVEDRRSNCYRARHTVDEVVPMADLGYLIMATVAS